MSESKVLSAVLQDKQIHHLLQADADTLLATYGDVWSFIKEYYSDNNTLPPYTIVIDKFPDFVYENGVGSTKHHLDELRREYLDRQMRVNVRQAATLIQDGESEKAAEYLMGALRNLNQEVGLVKDVDAGDTEAAIAHIKDLIDDQRKAHGIRFGMPAMDMCWPAGIRGGQLGIMMAYPSIGKSYITLYFLAQAWLQGFTPMIISLEMSESEVRNRLYTILGKMRWSLRKLSSGDVDIEEFEAWHRKTWDGKPLFHIISTDNIGGAVTPETIRAKINQYKPDVVACDYLQLMSPNSGGADSEVVRMKNLSRELKLLAMSEKVPIIAISSATPTDATDMSSPPTLGQTAWSRQIAYDADWVISLGRDLSDDVIQLVGRKNREGMLPDILLMADFDSGSFTFQGFPDLQ